MRTWVVASAFAVIVAGSGFYAVVGSPFAKVGPKADAPVDKVLLFSAPKNIPEDLIATKLAIQPVEPPKVQEKKKLAPPKKVQANTKPKPKKPVAVAG